MSCHNGNYFRAKGKLRYGLATLNLRPCQPLNLHSRHHQSLCPTDEMPPPPKTGGNG
jgi:hypothetical protein